MFKNIHWEDHSAKTTRLIVKQDKTHILRDQDRLKTLLKRAHAYLDKLNQAVAAEASHAKEDASRNNSLPQQDVSEDRREQMNVQAFQNTLYELFDTTASKFYLLWIRLNMTKNYYLCFPVTEENTICIHQYTELTKDLSWEEPREFQAQFLKGYHAPNSGQYVPDAFHLDHINMLVYVKENEMDAKEYKERVCIFDHFMDQDMLAMIKEEKNAKNRAKMLESFLLDLLFCRSNDEQDEEE